MIITNIIRMKFFVYTVITIVTAFLLYILLKPAGTAHIHAEEPKGGEEPKEPKEPKGGAPAKGMAMKSFALPSLDADMKKVSILTTEQDGTLRPLEEIVFGKEGTKTIIESKLNTLKTPNLTVTGDASIRDITYTAGLSANGSASSYIQTPNGQLRLNSFGIIFGGQNNTTSTSSPRHLNSGQISTIHDSNALSIVGLGNDVIDRKVKVYDKLCIGNTCIDETHLKMLTDGFILQTLNRPCQKEVGHYQDQYIHTWGDGVMKALPNHLSQARTKYKLIGLPPVDTPNCS